MGTWGSGAFENDAAADWAASLTHRGSAELIRTTLAAACQVPAHDLLDAPRAVEALAAAEVVAAAAGRPLRPDVYSEDAIAWAEHHPEVGTRELIALASRTIDRIAGERSELRDLWHEGEEEAADWDRAVEDLRSRLHP